MGVAGDMLSAALLGLEKDPDAAVAELNALGLPGVVYSLERTARCGIAALRVVVSVNGEVEGHAHHHHAHHHGHHEHRSLADILGIVGSIGLPERVKEDVSEVYRMIAAAEGRAHACTVDEIHFHELGAMDAVADICAVCWLMNRLSPGEVVSSPLNLGGGTVKCAHGVLSVPAPATAFLVEGVSSYADASAACELTTPTGAALIRRFASRFGAMPEMRISSVGHGAGSRDMEGRANILRCFLGEADGCRADEVAEFVCNIDDMTGEDMSFACDRIFEAGALDVAMVPAMMKKGRQGTVLVVLSALAKRDAVADAIFRHTTTIGLRERVCSRRVLERREEALPLDGGFTMRRKTVAAPGGERSKVEHDDLAAFALARGISIAEARAAAFSRTFSVH